MTKTFTDEQGISRCWWCDATEQYVNYHDQEWGFPVADDRHLFEKLCLESFQSGLSWRTILEKRENFRRAFANFDFYEMAKFDERNVERLLQDAGIVRHRGKIEAVINNARCCIELVEREGSLAKFIWQFEPKDQPTQFEMRSQCEESKALSKALKKQGWKFVGPTTAYAFMQSMGMVNDHVDECEYRALCNEARAAFVRP